MCMILVFQSCSSSPIHPIASLRCSNPNPQANMLLFDFLSLLRSFSYSVQYRRTIFPNATCRASQTAHSAFSQYLLFGIQSSSSRSQTRADLPNVSTSCRYQQHLWTLNFLDGTEGHPVGFSSMLLLPPPAGLTWRTRPFHTTSVD